MNCKKVRNNFVLYIEKNLTGRVTKTMKVHLDSCKSCSRLLEEFTGFYSMLGEKDRIQPSPYFWNRLKQRIYEDEKAIHPVWSWLTELKQWARPANMIAVLIIGIVVGYMLGNFPQTNDQIVSQINGSDSTTQQVFDIYNMEELNDLPKGSLEATYFSMISGS
ncbi:MAG: hypothetical protein A2161_22075 [Candidatus Schekmanbacteria bacterium RBG_13_48_7]|uniref:Zinc-finger domain-containing protein n=1 Tax=Candidatus Schekmanbacteria bacterium RBG_13_48_7 TaxID=1817878 RepID=A0A1F7RY98_9BACT|nr:MAG: hypothetical protein A2161_22075 [Candidatus Schekmanbacteria bacterium RBG_13_48_7]